MTVVFARPPQRNTGTPMGSEPPEAFDVVGGGVLRYTSNE